MHCTLISDLQDNHKIDNQDRGLHYGDGLFETMLLSNGKIKYWPEHFRRLSRSAERLDMACPDRQWFEKKLQPYFDLQQQLIIKIILTRGSGGRGLDLPESMPGNVYLFRYNINNSIDQYVNAYTSQITLSSNKHLAGLKHLNRLDYVLATRELNRRKQFNEALLFDNNGFIIESIVNNFFFVKEDVIFTPDLRSSGVDGVMRRLILKNLKQFQKNVKIGHYSKQDILMADECFLCNSVQGVRPVTQIDNKKFTVGSITKSLQQIFHGPSSD